MDKNNKFKYILISIVIILTTISAFSSVNSKKALRLAVWNNSTTAIVLDDGEVSGFEPELFRALSNYLSRPVEIKIYESKAASLEALRNNEVDVIMSSLFSQDIADEFEFTNIMVRHVDALLCSVGNTYFYQEYDAMENKTIGYLDRGKTIEPILQYLRDKINNPQFISFDTVQEIREALEAGEIELATFGLGALDNSYTVLDRFNALPTYYITRQGESRALNDALSSFLSNSHEFYNDLYYEFYPRSITTELTKEELEYIKSAPEITAVSFINKNVFSSLDDDENIIGIFPDIIRKINEITGLKINIITNTDDYSILQMLEEDKADVAIGLDCLEALNSNPDYILCDSIMKVPMELIVRRATILDPGKTQKIAISKENCTVDKYVKRNYSNWEIIYEKDLEDRYDLLINNKVDCLIDSSYSYNYLSSKNEFQKLTRYPVSLFLADTNVVVKADEGEILAQIMNKSLIVLKKNYLNSIVEQNISKIVYTPNLLDLFISHRIEYLGILSLILIFFSLIYIMASNRRRKDLEESNNDLIYAEQVAIEANKAKGVFLARMSHDMRTPLGAVIGLAEFGIKEAESANIKSYFADINDSAKYLLSLMDDILDSQKLQNDNFEFKYSIVDLSNTIQRVKRVIENKATEKDIELIITNECANLDRFVFADEKRISQIFVNILNNAIKYTKPKGKIYWDITYKKINNNKIVVFTKIRDTGVGMSEDFLQTQLFKPFSKELNSLSQSEGGTGLGLSICKKLVDQMHGTINCDSLLDFGTTFTIELALKLVGEEEAKAFKASLTKSDYSKYDTLFDGVSILVCDDTEINIKIVKKILEKKGIYVDVAYNGEQAISKVKEKYFDAILMDIRMPILDGLEATKIIREFNKTVPIIAFSANAYADDVKHSLDVGMNAHLAKPIDIDKLFETLEQEIFKSKE